MQKNIENKQLLYKRKEIGENAIFRVKDESGSTTSNIDIGSGST